MCTHARTQHHSRTYTRQIYNTHTRTHVPGLESFDEDQLSGEDEAKREGLPADGEAGELEGGRHFDTLGEFVHAGAAGARRKLLTWKVRFDLEECESCFSILQPL